MTEPKPTIGKAIDQILEALGAFEERDQGTILSTVYAHLQIAPANSAARVGLPDPLVEVTQKEHVPPTHSRHEAKSKHPLDIRTLKDQKQPNSARQMACIVAYYLQEHARTTKKSKRLQPRTWRSTLSKLAINFQ